MSPTGSEQIPIEPSLATPPRVVGRHACVAAGCFASFSTGAPSVDDLRHCNRTGRDGGHAHRWDGRSWQLTAGVMEHDTQR